MFYCIALLYRIAHVDIAVIILSKTDNRIFFLRINQVSHYCIVLDCTAPVAITVTCLDTCFCGNFLTQFATSSSYKDSPMRELQSACIMSRIAPAGPPPPQLISIVLGGGCVKHQVTYLLTCCLCSWSMWA